MSDYVQQPGQGSLFKNDKKENDKHPDYKGNYTNEKGEKCNIAAWLKTAKSGMKFMSLSLDFEPWDKQGGGQQQGNSQDPSKTFYDNSGTEAFKDDVPF